MSLNGLNRGSLTGFLFVLLVRILTRASCMVARSSVHVSTTMLQIRLCINKYFALDSGTSVSPPSTCGGSLLSMSSGGSDCEATPSKRKRSDEEESRSSSARDVSSSYF